MLKVFPTSRAIRSFYNTFLQSNSLLPKAITIAELEQKAILVPNLSLADEDIRLLLMQEASNFVKLELLHIQREFFSFLKNSTYLFRFFEELAHEKVPLEALVGADTYAHYGEHLEVLQSLLKHYEALLLKHQLFDRITLPKNYTLNEHYVRSLGEIHLYLEGFLSAFEVELLEGIAKLVPLKIEVVITAYNTKMQRLFSQLLDKELQINHRYIIDFSTKKIIDATITEALKQEPMVCGCASRIAQIGYIQNSIARFVEEGLSPEDIVVVLPDESFSETLMAFDLWHNLNFAMGISYKLSPFYQKLMAIWKFLREDNIEDAWRIKRLQISDETLESFKSKWYEKVQATWALEQIRTLLADQAEDTVLLEALFTFEHFLNNAPSIRLEQIVRLFLNRLNELSTDDTKGGKVTVLGLLETRGVAYKGVIIADFNDDFIPRKSQKDLFLSSALRQLVGLPTKHDRENLQRYYYHQLLSKAQKIAISYVKNEMTMPSRFLNELGFGESQTTDDNALLSLILDQHSAKAPYFEPIIDEPYELKAHKLSATKLKTLLTCKRKFYFQYVAKLKEAKMPTRDIDEQTVGNRLHKALEEAISNTTLQDEKLLYSKLESLLKKEQSHETEEYFADLWLAKLRPFIRNEVERFNDGFRVLHKELAYEAPFNGFILEGKIDRIDSLNDELFIIDYKSGKVPTTTEKTLEKTTDFQLVFYALICESLGKIGGLYYYDLADGKLVREHFFEEKKSILADTLKTLEEPINGYELCEDIASCRYCPYVVLCAKEELI